MEDHSEKKGYLRESFRLFHLKDKKGADPALHYHEFYKLLFLLEGSGEYLIGGKRYPLRAGDAIAVGSLMTHKPVFPAGSVYDRIILFISPAVIRRPEFSFDGLFSGESGHVLRPSAAELRTLHFLLSALEKEETSGDYGREPMREALLTELLVTLGRSMEEKDRHPLPLPESGGKTAELISYLDAHITDELSADELAASFFISKYHMMRRFREETGNSIHAYVSDRRLLLARDMIRDGVSATDACFASGFRSYSAFARAYVKRFGSAPTGRNENRLTDAKNE